MGVPSFYKWLTEKYPKIVCSNYILECISKEDSNNNNNDESNQTKKKLRFNNLYIDMNGVIHNSTHPKNGSTLSPIDTDDVTKVNLFKQLDELVNTVQPTNLLYIAMDGVPPRAKATEQRKRRFRSARETKDALEKRLPTDQQFEPFDSNCISPATEFMAKVNEWVLSYAQSLVKRMPTISIVVSDATVPGEGEHKIMDFIRAHSAEHWPSDTSHVFYGMDADLIFLGLSTHLSHFFVLRDLGAQIYCQTCKNNGHLAYECQSAVAKKRLNDSGRSSKLVVRNIPVQADEVQLTRLFSRFGKVLSTRIERAVTKHPSLTAYLEMDSVDTAISIVGYGANYYLNGQKLSVHYVSEKVTTPTTPTNEVDDDDSIPSKSVFIPNLDTRTHMFDVKSLFSSCGDIEDAYFIKSMKDPKIKYVVIKFFEEEAAKRALAMNGCDFYGTSLVVRKSRPQTTSQKVPASEEQKKQKEQEKEEKKLKKLEDVNTFLAMCDPNTTIDTAYFYLGLSEWNIEAAYQTYLAYGKSQHKQTVVSNVRNDELFDFVNLDYFREYFKYSLLSTLPESVANKINMNRVINDFTMMCMLLGNDFLPHLPTLAIKDGSIELMLTWYADWLRSFENQTSIEYLTTGSNINYKPFYHLLLNLSKWESTIFPEKLEKMYKKEIFRLDQLIPNNPNLEPIRRNLDGEINYYKLKLSVRSDQITTTAESVCKNFTEGLAWVLRYYTVGCPAWSWYYPYHYAPMIKDLCAYVKNLMETQQDTSNISFDIGAPLEPFIHLLSVLPQYSSKLLPPALAQGVVLEPSPIYRLFEERFRIDPNGEDVSWKGVILLEFINTTTLSQIARPIIDSLSQEELLRNQFGKDKYIRNDSEILDFDQHLNFIKQQTNHREPGKHKLEIDSHYKPLNKIDLLWPERRFYTLSPEVMANYDQLPTFQPMINPPTSNLPTEVNISEVQSTFLDWRNKQSSVDAIEKLLSSIDLSNSFTMGVDKNQSSSLCRVLSNEISADKSIKLISDTDQQMIVHIQFNQIVKLEGIKLVSTISKETSPKSVKVYFNQRSVDFSSLESLQPVFTFELNEGDNQLMSDYLEFGKTKIHQTNSITIFIESNSGENCKTNIEKIILF